MKKQLLLMSALALTGLTTIASCGQNKGVVYTPGEYLKVGLICLHDETSTYDKNFIDAFTKAFTSAQEKGYINPSDKVTNSIKTGIPEGSECYKSCQEFVNQGYNLIFTDSFGHDAYAHSAANTFSNVQFSSATGVEAKSSGLDNFHNAFAAIYEGRYLAGVSAAQYLIENGKQPQSDTIHLAYVGAYPYAEVISGFTSWYLGVKSVFNNVEMKVTFTNDWLSESKEATAAEKLIKEYGTTKIDCMSQHADSYGAPGVCKRSNIPNVSYNIPLDKDPYNSIYIAYSKINWQPYYDNAIKSMFEGSNQFANERDKNWVGDLSTGSVEFDYSTDKITLNERKAKIEEARKSLEEHKLHIFDTSKFTVNEMAKGTYDSLYEFGAPKLGDDYTIDGNGNLLTMKGASTDGARDQELISTDGEVKYINESYYRSAPSFDLFIDGITVC